MEKKPEANPEPETLAFACCCISGDGSACRWFLVWVVNMAGIITEVLQGSV